MLRIRQVVIESGREYVKRNNETYQRILKGKEDPKTDKYVSVAFDHEDEFVRFTDWVFGEYGSPKGLGFAEVPVSLSIRVQPWLLRKSLGSFGFRAVKVKDFENTSNDIVSPYPFDVVNIEGKHVPGVKP